MSPRYFETSSSKLLPDRTWLRCRHPKYVGSTFYPFFMTFRVAMVFMEKTCSLNGSTWVLKTLNCVLRITNTVMGDQKLRTDPISGLRHIRFLYHTLRMRARWICFQKLHLLTEEYFYPINFVLHPTGNITIYSFRCVVWVSFH